MGCPAAAAAVARAAAAIAPPPPPLAAPVPPLAPPCRMRCAARRSASEVAAMLVPCLYLSLRSTSLPLARGGGGGWEALNRLHSDTAVNGTVNQPAKKVTRFPLRVFIVTGPNNPHPILECPLPVSSEGWI